MPRKDRHHRPNQLIIKSITLVFRTPPLLRCLSTQGALVNQCITEDTAVMQRRYSRDGAVIQRPYLALLYPWCKDSVSTLCGSYRDAAGKHNSTFANGVALAVNSYWYGTSKHLRCQ